MRWAQEMGNHENASENGRYVERHQPSYKLWHACLQWGLFLLTV